MVPSLGGSVGRLLVERSQHRRGVRARRTEPRARPICGRGTRTCPIGPRARHWMRCGEERVGIVSHGMGRARHRSLVADVVCGTRTDAHRRRPFSGRPRADGRAARRSRRNRFDHCPRHLESGGIREAISSRRRGSGAISGTSGGAVRVHVLAEHAAVSC